MFPSDLIWGVASVHSSQVDDVCQILDSDPPRLLGPTAWALGSLARGPLGRSDPLGDAEDHWSSERRPLGNTGGFAAVFLGF